MLKIAAIEAVHKGTKDQFDVTEHQNSNYRFYYKTDSTVLRHMQHNKYMTLFPNIFVQEHLRNANVKIYGPAEWHGDFRSLGSAHSLSGFYEPKFRVSLQMQS